MASNKKRITSDERTKAQTSRAAMITLCIIWAGVLAYAIYKGIRFGIGSVTEELVILCGSVLVFLCAQFSRYDIDLPKSFSGRALPVGNDRRSVISRVLNYLAEGVIDSLIVSTINVMVIKFNPNYTLTKAITLSSESATLVANFMIDFALLFVIFAVICAITGERNVKKYIAQTKSEEEFDSSLKQ